MVKKDWEVLLSPYEMHKIGLNVLRAIIIMEMLI